jgi:UDPglucose 6-dehydrogenase
VVVKSALEACQGAHAVAVLTEWDEFKALDFKKVHEGMYKPAFVFDGRNILPHAKLKEMGFKVFAIGKPA